MANKKLYYPSNSNDTIILLYQQDSYLVLDPCLKQVDLLAQSRNRMDPGLGGAILLAVFVGLYLLWSWSYTNLSAMNETRYDEESPLVTK